MRAHPMPGRALSALAARCGRHLTRGYSSCRGSVNNLHPPLRAVHRSDVTSIAASADTAAAAANADAAAAAASDAAADAAADAVLYETIPRAWQDGACVGTERRAGTGVGASTSRVGKGGVERLISPSTSTSTFTSTSGQGLAHIARHVIRCIERVSEEEEEQEEDKEAPPYHLDPHSLSQSASYDVASNFARPNVC